MASSAVQSLPPPPPPNQCDPNGQPNVHGSTCTQSVDNGQPESGRGDMCVGNSCDKGEGKKADQKSTKTDKKGGSDKGKKKGDKPDKKDDKLSGGSPSVEPEKKGGSNNTQETGSNGGGDNNGGGGGAPPPGGGGGGTPPVIPPDVQPPVQPPPGGPSPVTPAPVPTQPASGGSSSGFNLDFGKLFEFIGRFVHVGGTVNWERLGGTTLPNTFNAPGVIRLAGTFEAGLGYNFAPGKGLIGPSCSYVGAFVDRIGKETTDKNGDVHTDIDTSYHHGLICRLLGGWRIGNHSVHLGGGAGVLFREPDLTSSDPNAGSNRASLFDLNLGYGWHFKELPNHFLRFGLHLYLIPESLKPGEPRPDIYIGPGLSFQ